MPRPRLHTKNFFSRAAPLPAPVQAFAPEFAARFGRILAGLARLVAAGFLRNPRLVLLIIPLWTRLNRAARRCERLMAHLAAGHLPKPHRSGPSGPPPSGPALPTSRGWLVRELGSEAACHASQMQALLAVPAVIDLLSVAPTARRIVNPIPRPLAGIVRPSRWRQPLNSATVGGKTEDTAMPSTNLEKPDAAPVKNERLEKIVDLLYRAVLRRYPDESGRIAYAKLLEQGKPELEIIRQLANCPEFASKRLIPANEPKIPGIRIDDYDDARDPDLARYITPEVVALSAKVQHASIDYTTFYEVLMRQNSKFKQEEYLIFHALRFHELACAIKNLPNISTILDFGFGGNSYALQELFPTALVSVADRPQMQLPADRFHSTHSVDLEDDRLDQIDMGARFDMIVFSEVIEHLRMHPARVIRFLLRHLTPTGSMIITTPNLFSRNKMRQINLRRTPLPTVHLEYSQADGPHFHFREYAQKDMLGMIDGGGGRTSAFLWSGCWDQADLRDVIPRHELSNMFFLVERKGG